MWRLPLVALPILIALVAYFISASNGTWTVILVLSGTNLAICTQVWLAEHEVLVDDLLVKTLWISSVIGLLVVTARQLPRRQKLGWEAVASTAILFASPFLAWTQPMWRHRSVLFGAPFSNSNNDLAIYVVSSDNFLHAGFREFGRVVGYQAGALTNFEVAGSSSATALISKLTGAPVWRVSTLVMLLVLLMTVTALFLLGRLLSLRPVIAAMVAALGIVGPWSVQVQQNFFLSQAVSRMALVVGLVSVLQIFLGESRFSVLAGSLGFMSAIWVSLVTYPSGSIVSGAILFGVVPVVWFAFRRSERTYTCRRLSERSLVVLASSAAVVPLVENRWSLIASNVSLYSRANVTGWSNPTDSIWQLLLIPIRGAGGVPLLVIVSITLLVFGIRVARQREPSGQLLVSTGLLLGLSLTYALVVTRVGISAYQAWKTLATLQVLIPVLIVCVVFHHTVQTNKSVAPRVFLVLLPVLLAWNAYRAGDTYRFATQLPTMELEQIANRLEIQRDGLLIGLHPYLETMIAPVILNLHGTVYASDSYLGPGSVDPARCALVRGKAHSNAIQLSRSLQLSPKEVCVSP